MRTYKIDGEVEIDKDGNVKSGSNSKLIGVSYTSMPEMPKQDNSLISLVVWSIVFHLILTGVCFVLMVNGIV